MAKKRVIGNPTVTPYNPNGLTIEVDDALSDTSENPVQNKVINGVLQQLINNKTGVGHTHKMSDLEDYTVDDALSETSENPVQNKVIKAYVTPLAEKIDKSIKDLTLTIYADKAASFQATRTDGTAVEGIATALATSAMVNDLKKTMTQYVNTSIGDVETALENIISKYGLGGDSV